MPFLYPTIVLSTLHSQLKDENNVSKEYKLENSHH